LKIENISYSHNDKSLHGYMAFKETNKKIPAVLIAHAWGGRDDFACKKAEYLAELGYLGFALDMYGDAKTGKSTEENTKLMTPLMEDRKLLLGRIHAALEKVKSLPMVDTSKIGAIGFCFGGLCVLDLARSGANINGVVSFHGLLNKPEKIERKTINAKLLVMHGYEDPMGKPSQALDFMEEMTSLKADWQMQFYGNTQHAFTNPSANDQDLGLIFNKMAEKRSLQSMKNFFKEIFS
jgi:dienelactone hydrolase